MRIVRDPWGAISCHAQEWQNYFIEVRPAALVITSRWSAVMDQIVHRNSLPKYFVCSWQNLNLFLLTLCPYSANSCNTASVSASHCSSVGEQIEMSWTYYKIADGKSSMDKSEANNHLTTSFGFGMFFPVSLTILTIFFTQPALRNLIQLPY